MQSTEYMQFSQARRLLTCIAVTVLLPSVIWADVQVIEGSDGWLFPTWENMSTVDKPRIDANLTAIATVKNQLAERQIQLIVLLVPMKAAFYADRLPTSHPISNSVMQQYEYVNSGFQAAGVRTVDVINTMRALEKNKQFAFFRTDYHWSAQGAEACADAAASVIQQHVTFDRAPEGGKKLGEWVNTRRYGDLATRFMTAEQRMVLRREVFRVRSEPKESDSLLDDDPAEIHVVGNSFVQPYLGFPQKLSQALNRPVSLTWNYGNVGPWAVFLKYLESDDYRTNKPKVILWQLNEPRMDAGPDSKNSWDAPSLMSMAIWMKRLSAAIAKSRN